LIHEHFSAHQGVEDDELNMICLGGLVVGHALAWELVQTFLAARFSGAARHRRRLAKVAALCAAPGSRTGGTPSSTQQTAVIETEVGSREEENLAYGR
jgi:ribose 5-phosphate isomerase B